MNGFENTSSFLFNQADFVFRNGSDNLVSFHALSGATEAYIHFSKKNNVLISLDQSPFGGFVYTSLENCELIEKLIKQVYDFALQNKITHVIIRCAPEIYSSYQTQIDQILFNLHFDIKFKDITQIIRITDQPLPLNTHRRRRLKKCKLGNFNFMKLSEDNLFDAYKLFVESRENKGYPVTMRFPDLLKMFGIFPNHYLLFGVFDKTLMIAASVCIVVNENILYCFYLGDAIQYRKFSPVTFLINEIYTYAANHNFKIIDLGISTDKGILNDGLYAFKKSLGAIDSPKITLEKKL